MPNVQKQQLPRWYFCCLPACEQVTFVASLASCAYAAAGMPLDMPLG